MVCPSLPLHHTISNILIGHGIDQVVSPAGRFSRDDDGKVLTFEPNRLVFFLYPPSENNLRLLDSISGESHGLEKICTKLEGGLQVPLCSTHALYIPAACGHAEVTAAGGMMVSKAFVNPDTLLAMAKLLASGCKWSKEFANGNEYPMWSRWEWAAKAADPATCVQAWYVAKQALLRTSVMLTVTGTSHTRRCRNVSVVGQTADRRRKSPS